MSETSFDISTPEGAAVLLEKYPVSAFPLKWNEEVVSAGTPCQWVPNRFDTGSTDAMLVPVSFDEPWETLTFNASKSNATFILGIFPNITQLHQRFYLNLRRVGIPVMTLPRHHGKAARSIAQQLPLQAVVTMQSDLSTIIDSVPSLGLPGRYIQLILGMHEKPDGPARPNILREVHLVPGVVGLYQCAVLAGASEKIFHPSERFLWEFEGKDARVTDASSSPRFARAKLPHAYGIEQRECACGNTIRMTYL